jgi:mannose-1-phosphate guanylyltransferase
MHRERVWVILLTGGGGDSHESKNGRVKAPSREFAPAPDQHVLLELALLRARSIVPREQIAVIVDRAQKRCRGESLAMLPGANLIMEPYHRGSAPEMLLALLTILERDPLARVIVMPSHHYVSNEAALAESLLDAATPTAQTRNNLALIGIKPDRADTESGYILPGRWFEDGTRSVLRMIKPSAMFTARQLVARGALWDSSIVAARALLLLGIIRVGAPDLVDQMETALAQGADADVRQRALTQLYGRLPFVDLAHVLAQGTETEYRVITSRSCGWSNPAAARRAIAAGRPGRVAATV